MFCNGAGGGEIRAPGGADRKRLQRPVNGARGEGRIYDEQRAEIAEVCG